MTLGGAVLMGVTFFPVASTVTQTSGRDGWMAVYQGMQLEFLMG